MALTEDQQPIAGTAEVDVKFDEWWHMMCVAETIPLNKDLVQAAFWAGVMLSEGKFDYVNQQFRNRHNPDIENPNAAFRS